MIVNFGRGTTEIELAENAAVKVDLADYTVARQGDSISVTKGKTYPNQFMLLQANPNAVGRAMALELEIQLSQPLSGPEKKTPARPAKQPADEPQPEPADPSAIFPQKAPPGAEN